MSIGEKGDGSAEEEEEVEGTEEDDKAYQACYQFVPRTIASASDLPDLPPTKRRKTAHLSSETASSQRLFPLLLGGHESEQNAETRHINFQKSSSKEESVVAHSAKSTDDSLFDEVLHFVEHAKASAARGRLPTGLIVCGPSPGSQARWSEEWTSLQQRKKKTIAIQLDSNQTSNMMVALKNLIRAAIVQLDGREGYKKFLNEPRRRTQMNFDLEILREFIALREIHECVINLTGIEVFDTGLLIHLLSLLHSWMDRIPLVLLVGISTTSRLFESRLPKSTTRLLDCTCFDVSAINDYSGGWFNTCYGEDDSSLPCLGPSTSSVLVDLSREQDVSLACLVRARKYAKMSHFFSNALSVLLDEGTKGLASSQELCEAIRSTGSFRILVEERLDTRDLETARDLLCDDKVLIHTAKEAIAHGKDAISRHHSAVDLLNTLLNVVSPANTPRDPFSVEVHALSGAPFIESMIFSDVISKMTTLTSDHMRTLLGTLQEHRLAAELDICARLKTLNKISPPGTKAAPLRSAYHPTHATTTPTTVVKNNKVSLSRQGPKLSPEDMEYTSLVDDLIETLTSYFEHNICNPTTLFLHEAFVYDFKSPLHTVFTPRPRHVIERALSSPHDYLGCTCCDGQTAEQTSPTQPPTSILWHLWCEAGGIVNVCDLWTAFASAIVSLDDEREDDDDNNNNNIQHPHQNGDGEGDGHDNDNDKGLEKPLDTGRGRGRGIDERTALALFYRGLAELRMLGFVKPTKRKADCVAKTAWRGL